jgi:hypothetical protein
LNVNLENLFYFFTIKYLAKLKKSPLAGTWWRAESPACNPTASFLSPITMDLL